MDATSHIEGLLQQAIADATVAGAPPKLAEALRYAVFPGGARVRPRLCLAVAMACGAKNEPLVNAAAASVELLHCASLVHDDLPCFDDADVRRGRPSVHKVFGEPLAVLVGDGLIVQGFALLAQGAVDHIERLPALITTISEAVGMPHGIVAGQGWESEVHVPVDAYHRAKTGALFVGAAMSGAVAAGADPLPWRTLGERLGAAYQAADDLRDVFADVSEIGKPVNQDAAHGRPSLVEDCGLQEAVGRLESYVSGAIDAIPACEARPTLEALILSEAKRLKPKKLSQIAA